MLEAEVAVLHEYAPAVERLHALSPDAAVLRGESYVTVVGLLTHRHLKTEAERSDEIGVFVTIIGKSVHNSHLLGAGIEV